MNFNDVDKFLEGVWLKRAAIFMVSNQMLKYDAAPIIVTTEKNFIALDRNIL